MIKESLREVEGEGVRDAAVGVSLCDVVGFLPWLGQGDRDGRREKAGDMTTDLCTTLKWQGYAYAQ